MIQGQTYHMNNQGPSGWRGPMPPCSSFLQFMRLHVKDSAYNYWWIIKKHIRGALWWDILEQVPIYCSCRGALCFLCLPLLCCVSWSGRQVHDFTSKFMALCHWWYIQRICWIAGGPRGAINVCCQNMPFIYFIYFHLNWLMVSWERSHLHITSALLLCTQT